MQVTQRDAAAVRGPWSARSSGSWSSRGYDGDRRRDFGAASGGSCSCRVTRRRSALGATGTPAAVAPHGLERSGRTVPATRSARHRVRRRAGRIASSTHVPVAPTRWTHRAARRRTRPTTSASVSRVTSLVELRVLEGPNLYFPRAAIKLTLDIGALSDVPTGDGPGVRDAGSGWRTRGRGSRTPASGSGSRSARSARLVRARRGRVRDVAARRPGPADERPAPDRGRLPVAAPGAGPGDGARRRRACSTRCPRPTSTTLMQRAAERVARRRAGRRAAHDHARESRSSPSPAPTARPRPPG